MSHRSPRSIPAAALGNLSPVDPGSGELFAKGRIPPRNISFDYSIMDHPSPLHLPSPGHRHSPHRLHFDLNLQPDRITEEDTISIESTKTQRLPPTVSPTPDTAAIDRLRDYSLAASRRRRSPNHQPSTTAQNRQDQQDREDEQIRQDHREGGRRRSSVTADPFFRPRAIDFAETLRNSAPCIFAREECEDVTVPRPVCYECHERVKRLSRRRSRVVRRLLLVIWVACQSGVVAVIVYLIMAGKHKRAMKQILDRMD